MKILNRWVKHYKCYTLEKNFRMHLGCHCKYYKDNYIELMNDGDLLIKSGYSWNGCSPKFEIFDMVVGTPEGTRLGKYSKTYFPSLVHDVLYQVGQGKRKFADRIFLKMLKRNNFRARWLYYLAVRIFGKKAFG